MEKTNKIGRKGDFIMIKTTVLKYIKTHTKKRSNSLGLERESQMAPKQVGGGWAWKGGRKEGWAEGPESLDGVGGKVT